jgi:biopolymer transport protein ExbB
MLDQLRDIAGAGGWVLGAILGVSTLAWALVAWKLIELGRARRVLGQEGQGGEESVSGLLRTAREQGRRTAQNVLRPLVEAGRVELERHLGLIAGLAVALPLLGLLGTVLGMITTFDVITLHGTGEPRLMAHGIRQALLTTEAGLLAALPVLLAHRFLASRARRLETELWVEARRIAFEKG